MVVSNFATDKVALRLLGEAYLHVSFTLGSVMGLLVPIGSE